MKGQITLEMLISFSVFIAIIGIFIGIGQTQLESTENAVEKFNAKLSAEKCATVIDFYFANGGENKVELEEKCSIDNNEKTIVKVDEAQASILNDKSSIKQSKIEVESDGHYR